MADKEATVYIIDQGASTGECHNGRVESDLDYGMRYIWDKITTTLAASRVSLGVGIIGLRTNETNNPMEAEDGYENISIMKPLGSIDMTHLRDLQRQIKPSQTEIGDAVSAIVIAIDMIEKFTTLKTGKPGKYARKIVLVTDGQGRIEDDDIDPIAQKINDCQIDLVVVGVDFDDVEFGFNEEDKSKTKMENEALLRSLTEKCSNGIFGTAAEAIADLAVPRVKTTRPYSTFQGGLTLGDPERYPESSIWIDVERYFKTKTAKPLSASSFVARSSTVNNDPSGQSSLTLPFETDVADVSLEVGLSAVRNTRTYKVNDAAAPGGKKDVELEELAKGFEYGRTAVHISESDENVTNLETFKSFSIIGFIPNDKYERYLDMGESCITIAQRTNDKARMALSSLIHALHELDSYAVARIVTKDRKHPQILLLAPSIESDLEALVDVPLPFAEDVRVYRFPPLDRILTTSGAAVSKHRNLPTDELVVAMSDYVDSMDLSTFGRDEEDQPMEYMTVEETFSPLLHRINQAVRRRAVEPNEPVPPPAEILLKWSNPPAELVSEAASQLENLIKTAIVKKVPPKAKGKRNRRDTIKPLSGLDVDALLGREKRQKISNENAIPEFKQMLSTAETVNSIIEAADQMASIIRSLITKSLGDSGYRQALENLRVMREELILLEEPGIYNDFVSDLKKRLVKGELGGDRRELWWEVKKTRLGLIDSSAVEASNVSEAEATEFYSILADLPSRVKVE